MTQSIAEAEELLPLTPTVFHILLAVAANPRHGYAIMQEVNARSDGRVGLGPGTLYGAIRRMCREGLLEKTDPPAGEQPDPRRRYYAITAFGTAAMEAEVERMKRLVTHAQATLRNSKA